MKEQNNFFATKTLRHQVTQKNTWRTLGVLCFSGKTFYKYFIITAFGFIPFYGMAQVQITFKDTAKVTPAPVAIVAPLPPAPDSNIKVYEPVIVQNTEDKVYQYQRYMHGTSPGFRVQIDFGQERNAVNKTKADFSTKYPSMTSYITYKQPYFRVSVGDFRTKLEAVCFLNKVKTDYPAAFIVADKIVPPPLQ